MEAARMAVRGKVWLFFALLVFLITGLGTSWWVFERSQDLAHDTPATYVGSETCRDCHAQQFADWQGSDHDLAMDHAKPETVRGDFNDATITVNGVASRFFRDGDKYMVHTQGRVGAMETFEVLYTFGHYPLQQYLVATDHGKLQALPLAWDALAKRWYHLYEKENVQPHEWLYWTNVGLNWNYMCAECHSTNLQKNYATADASYHTTWSEIDVSCESCHGPGSRHVTIASQKRWLADAHFGDGLTVHLKGAPSQVQIDTCGPCHSRRRIVQTNFTPGADFLDYHMPELIDSTAYYPDGQVLDEDYVYTSFHLSLMYQKGVKCTDCHHPHTTKLLAQGNVLCTRCHDAGKFDTPSHHFHTTNSTGAACVNCHMPTTTYMGVDARRDHSFRYPRPDLTLSLNIPNACNRCHQDQTAEWAQSAVEKWYGPKSKDKPFPLRQDFATVFAAARHGEPAVLEKLQQMTRATSLPDFLRASAVALQQHYPSTQTRENLQQNLTDKHPLVRAQAVRQLEPAVRLLAARQPNDAELNRHPLIRQLQERLLDTNFAVRSETVSALAPLGAYALALPDYQTALQEHTEKTKKLNDDPGPAYNLGNLYSQLVLGGASEYQEVAEQEYLRALQLNPEFWQARINLADFYYRTGRFAPATEQYDPILAKEAILLTSPDAQVLAANRQLLSQTHYQLALLLAEVAELQTNPNQATDPAMAALLSQIGKIKAEYKQVVQHLERAYELDSTRSRILYNLGIAYQKTEQWPQAEYTLRHACRNAVTSAEALVALVYLYRQHLQQPELAQSLAACLPTDQTPPDPAKLNPILDWLDKNRPLQ